MKHIRVKAVSKRAGALPAAEIRENSERGRVRPDRTYFRAGASCAIAALTFALSACVSPPAGAPAVKSPAPPAALQYSRSQPLFGLDEKMLTARFGAPRLDIRDKTVHKLQFLTAGGRCVLDAYLYATARGREPTVTHIDTRLTNGQDVDPASCGIR